MIIVPIILPLIEALGFNLTWFAILVAVNLQTAWLSPPVALSAYFLKGVVPEWDLKDIYLGMMQFMVFSKYLSFGERTITGIPSSISASGPCFISPAA